MSNIIINPYIYAWAWYTVPTTWLVAEYLLDWNANDTSGNGNNLTENWSIGYTTPSGASIQVADFDGTNDYLNWQADITSNNMSFSFWINPDSTPTENRHILDKRWSSLQFLLRTINSTSDSTNILFRDNTNTSNGVDWPSLSVWSWQHIVGIYDYDNNTWYIYIDNVDETTSTTWTFNNPLRSDTTQDLYVWKDSTTSNNYVDSKMCLIRIYDRALTSGDIENLYLEWQDKLGL